MGGSEAGEGGRVVQWHSCSDMGCVGVVQAWGVDGRWCGGWFGW